ncbi:unnamed protein product, partial [Choristocarpus tenellus]
MSVVEPLDEVVEATVGDVRTVKAKVLRLAALTERGTLANPGISDAYMSTKGNMRCLVDQLVGLSPLDQQELPSRLNGQWELVYSTVELFRSSPFFQMVEEGYGNKEKSDLFFKLHQLQTGSWGASTIGRITQVM